MLFSTSMLYLGSNACSSLQCLTSVSCFPPLRRRGYIECDHVFLILSPSSSLQRFILVSMLFSTSTLHLGFNAFLHFTSLFSFQLCRETLLALDVAKATNKICALYLHVVLGTHLQTTGCQNHEFGALQTCRYRTEWGLLLDVGG